MTYPDPIYPPLIGGPPPALPAGAAEADTSSVAAHIPALLTCAVSRAGADGAAACNGGGGGGGAETPSSLLYARRAPADVRRLDDLETPPVQESSPTKAQDARASSTEGEAPDTLSGGGGVRGDTAGPGLLYACHAAVGAPLPGFRRAASVEEGLADVRRLDDCLGTPPAQPSSPTKGEDARPSSSNDGLSNRLSGDGVRGDTVDAPASSSNDELSNRLSGDGVRGDKVDAPASSSNDELSNRLSGDGAQGDTASCTSSPPLRLGGTTQYPGTNDLLQDLHSLRSSPSPLASPAAHRRPASLSMLSFPDSAEICFPDAMSDLPISSSPPPSSSPPGMFSSSPWVSSQPSSVVDPSEYKRDDVADDLELRRTDTGGELVVPVLQQDAAPSQEIRPESLDLLLSCSSPPSSSLSCDAQSSLHLAPVNSSVPGVIDTPCTPNLQQASELSLPSSPPPAPGDAPLDLKTGQVVNSLNGVVLLPPENGCPAPHEHGHLRCIQGEAPLVPQSEYTSPEDSNLIEHQLPRPKRSTLVHHKLQYKKLATPFRSPLLKGHNGAPINKETKKDAVTDENTAAVLEASKSPGVSTPKLAEATATSSTGLSTKSDKPSRDWRTTKAAAQFKSPLSAVATSASASSVRPTPTIQALERRVQLLKRAVKVKSEGDEEVLEGLTRRWRDAAREVAWEVWELVRDRVGDGAGRSGAGWGAWGDGPGKKRASREDWGWGDRAAAKRPRIGGGYDAGGEGADADMEGEPEAEGLGCPDVEEEEKGRDTLGTMLRQLGIDPDTLGWDEEEGTFVGE